jgi:hypothetical protein
MNILRIIAATVSLSLSLASGAGLWHTTVAGLHITQERERIIQFDTAAKTLLVELLDAETGQRGAYTSQTCTIATVTTRPLRPYGGPEGFREISRSGRRGYGIGDMELDCPLNSSAKAARRSLIRSYG